MASDILKKAFRQATAEAARQCEEVAAPVKDADQLLREREAPMTAEDAIQRILLAWKDRDYFRQSRVGLGGPGEAFEGCDSTCNAASRPLTASKHL